MRVLAQGLAALSIPAIAREAGVSVPTVYRNFRTKEDLFEAIYPYSVRRARSVEFKPPTSMEDFPDGIRILFERYETFDDVERAAIASPGAEQIRHATIGSRVELAGKVAAAIAPELTPEEHARLARLVIVLTMSATARMLHEHLGRSVDEAVDDVEWIVRAVIAGRAAQRQRA